MLFFQLYLYLLFIYLFIISNAIAILSMCNSFQNGLRCSNCLILVAQNRLNCLVLMLKFACSRFSITRYIRYYFHFLSQDILPDQELDFLSDDQDIICRLLSTEEVIHGQNLKIGMRILFELAGVFYVLLLCLACGSGKL